MELRTCLDTHLYDKEGNYLWSAPAMSYATESVPEMVDHPKHYNSHPAGIECIDVIEPMSFNIGSAIKYLWRAGLKPGADLNQDLDKAIWYINREKERLSK